MSFLLAALVLCCRTETSEGPAGPLRLDRAGERWAKATLRGMSLEEKVGQLFMIWVRSRFLNEESPDYRKLVEEIRTYHVGGLALSVPVDGSLLVKSRPEEAALLLNRLQRESALPLIVAADFESGVWVRLEGSTVFPQAMAFGAAGRTDHAEAFGRVTALEARSVGVHWNFFPVADVNSNPANPIVNTRSFGEDPQQVGDLLAAHIRGARQGGLVTTAKHFPGHGDTDTDSHYGMARVGGDRARLRSVELPPFERAIEAGVDAIMVAHVMVPALEPAPDRVATTSSAIVTDLLKTELGFRGLVVTDALDMAGLTSLYAPDVGRAAVEAFLAGNDLLLIPADLAASWTAVVEAARTGEIEAARLDASVLKILETKASLGLHEERQVDVSRVAEVVGLPHHVALGQQVADEAVTLVLDGGRVLPLEREEPPADALPYLTRPEVRNELVAVVFSEDRGGDHGRVLAQEIRTRVPHANVVFVDPGVAGGIADEVLKAADEAKTVVVAVYAIPNPGRAAVGLEAGAAPDPSRTLLEKLLERAAGRTVVVALGSPYVAESFPKIETFVCTLSSAPVSERSAVKALFGEIELRGRLPVTIPGIASRGAGIVREASPPARREGAPP